MKSPWLQLLCSQCCPRSHSVEQIKDRSPDDMKSILTSSVYFFCVFMCTLGLSQNSWWSELVSVHPPNNKLLYQPTWVSSIAGNGTFLSPLFIRNIRFPRWTSQSVRHHRISSNVVAHIRACVLLGRGRPCQPSAPSRWTAVDEVVASVWLRSSFSMTSLTATTAVGVWANGQVLLFWRRAALRLCFCGEVVLRRDFVSVYSRPRCCSFVAFACSDAAEKESAATQLRNASRLGLLDRWLGLFTFSKKPEWIEHVQRSHAQGESSKGYRITLRGRQQYIKLSYRLYEIKRTWTCVVFLINLEDHIWLKLDELLK